MPKQAKSKAKTFAKHGILETSIPGLLIIKRPTYPDERGFFHEIFRLNQLESVGIKFKPIQWSHALSLPNVIRGIHTEKWQKLVYPITGKTFAAYVDVRPDLPSFGKVETIIFDNTAKDSPHTAVFIPPGVGNSVCAFADTPVHYTYLVDEYWDNSKAQGIAWDDPDLNVKWPVKNPIISERDKNNSTLREMFPKNFK